MNLVQRLVAYKITPAVLDATAGENICYLAAVAVMILGFNKLGRLSMTPAEGFLGILLILAVGLHLVCLGLLVRRVTGRWTDHGTSRR